MTPPHHEKVSAIVAVRNGEPFVGEALASIVSQSRPPDEILVVDDGSTDGTVDIVEHFRDVRLVRQSAAGQAAALNWGIVLSCGELLAFLDADDMWSLDKMEKQLAVLRGQPTVDLVFGHARQFVDPSSAATLEVPSGREVLAARVPGAALIRRSVFDRVGSFREDLRTAAAIEWLTRVNDAKMQDVVLPDVVLHRRIHSGNAGKAIADASGYFTAIRAVLARRRAKGGT